LTTLSPKEKQVTRYTFQCKRERTGLEIGKDQTITYVTEPGSWDELFEDFRDFLQGCGFTVPDGEIFIDEADEA
jgi:hypothetical protein